jgi:mannose-1-phosphate guanylyltransferase
MEAYETAIQEAVEKASQGYITFGIVPTKPETGYGYIERKGDDVISRENPIRFQPEDFIAKFLEQWDVLF